MREMVQRKGDLYSIAGILFLVFLFCLPFLFPLDTIVVEESYLQFASYLDCNLMHLAKDHALPFWAFHFGGGYPLIKHPDNMSLSPLFYLLILPFGSDNGLKLFLMFSYAVGAAGFYLLVRRVLKFSTVTSVLTTLYFIFNGFIAYQINTGNVKDQAWLYLPFIIYFLVLSREHRCSLFYCACLIALVIVNGFGLYLASMLLFIFLFLLFDPVDDGKAALSGRWGLLRNFLLVLAVSFALAAVKSFPILEFVRTSSRAFDNYFHASGGAMGVRKMVAAFLSRVPYAAGNEPIAGTTGLGMGSVMYFGVIPAIICFLSLIFNFAKSWKYVALTGIFLILSMARNSPIDLFYLLWHLPLFRSMHEVARYFSFPVVFLVPIVAGLFFSSGLFKKLRPRLQYAVYVIAFIGAADIFFVNTQYYVFTGADQDPAPAIRTGGAFFNVAKVPPDAVDPSLLDAKKKWTGKYDRELLLGLQYYLQRENIGLVNWYGNVPIKESVVPKYRIVERYGDYWRTLREDPTPENFVLENEDYRGECYFAGSTANKVTGIEWNANEIVIGVEQTSPGRLIVNQNYDREWRCDSGTVYDADGLLGIEMSDAGKDEAILRYCPVSFYLGAVVSIVTLLASGLYFFMPRRRRKKGRKAFV